MTYVKNRVKFYTNFSTEWSIISVFYIQRSLEFEVIILFISANVLILLKYGSQKTFTPNLKHMGVVLKNI